MLATGASVSIQRLDATVREATTCRQTFIYNRAGGSSATSRFSFGTREGGNWHVAK